MSIFLIMLGYFVVVLIVFEIVKHYLKKYINKRIDESLELLNKLENINKELDTKIDSVKIKMYDVYLDRCRESLRKKREMDNEYREMTRKVKEKIKGLFDLTQTIKQAIILISIDTNLGTIKRNFI